MSAMKNISNKSQMTAKELDEMINAKYLEYHKRIDLKKFGYVGNAKKIVNEKLAS